MAVVGPGQCDAVGTRSGPSTARSGASSPSEPPCAPRVLRLRRCRSRSGPPPCSVRCQHCREARVTPHRAPSLRRRGPRAEESRSSRTPLTGRARRRYPVPSSTTTRDCACVAMPRPSSTLGWHVSSSRAAQHAGPGGPATPWRGFVSVDARRGWTVREEELGARGISFEEWIYLFRQEPWVVLE